MSGERNSIFRGQNDISIAQNCMARIKMICQGSIEVCQPYRMVYPQGRMTYPRGRICSGAEWCMPKGIMVYVQEADWYVQGTERYVQGTEWNDEGTEWCMSREEGRMLYVQRGK